MSRGKEKKEAESAGGRKRAGRGRRQEGRIPAFLEVWKTWLLVVWGVGATT